MEFEKLLSLMVEKGGSDLFITAGVPPSMKVNGKVLPVTKNALTPEQTREFVGWIEEHEAQIRERVEGTSRYLELLDMRTHAVGTTVFVRFRFSTGDAMGMNMATLACDHVIQELITPATGIDCVSLSGNYCVDKKPSAINAQEGRGKRIYAEVELSASVLKEALKTTAADLSEVQYRKNLLGSSAAGSMGMSDW